MKLTKYSLLFVILAALFLVTGHYLDVFAQEDDLPWETPDNLSMSGGAAEPVLFTDADGVYHLLWQDAVAGFVYTNGDGRSWADPVEMTAPFTEPPFEKPNTQSFEAYYKPRLVTDNNGRLHAFWVNADGLLIYRRVEINNITNASSWTAEFRLSGSALTLTTAVDNDGRLHLAYIRPQPADTLPAGIYYRQSTDGGATWTDPVLVYESEYFRTADADTANLQMRLDGDGRIHLAWDNRALDTIYYGRSEDNGATWSEPLLVDSRQEADDAAAAGPAKVRLALNDGLLHMTWQATHGETLCTQYHQWSADGGATWSDRIAALADARGCPQDGRFLTSRNNLLFLLTTFEDVIYMQVWDGEQWSETAVQEPMLTFTDPTTFRTVTLGCRQTTVLPDNTLLVLGCGTGNDTDIWALRRPLGELANWSSRFAPPPIWNAPVPIAQSDYHLESPVMVAAADGRLHALWTSSSQPVIPGKVNTSASEATGIFYSRLDADRWSSPRPILQAPGGAAKPAIVAGPDGSLHAVWSGKNRGGVYYSRALADQAASVREWIEPVLLPGSEEIGASPDLIRNAAGQLFVVYTVPVNDERGIYLTRSDNNGDSWTEPVQIFRGDNAGWQVVGQPKLAVTEAQSLHVIWTRETLAAGQGTRAMVYSRSDDGGVTWSQPTPVTQESVSWYDIVGIGNRELHRFWQTMNDGLPILWHEVSYDNGLSWKSPIRIADSAVSGGPTAVLVDFAAQLHLYQLGATNEGALVLQAWDWDGTRWTVGDGLQLPEEMLGADAVTAAMTQNGRIGVAFSVLFPNSESEQLQDTLVYTSRSWDAPNATPTPLPTLTPTPPPQPTATLQPTPTATPVIPLTDPAVEPDRGFSVGPLSTNDPVGSIVLSILPAVLIVGIIFAIGLRIRKQK